MKSYLKLALLASLAIPLAACGRASPDAGQAAVLTAKPWFFGHGGVDPDPVTTGSAFTALTTSATYVNIQPQAIGIQYDNMMSSDGIPLSFEATGTFQVTDPVSLVKNFSGGLEDVNKVPAWYVNNIENVENSLVREAFRSQTMKALAIETSGTTAVEADVKTKLEAYITTHNIPVKLLNFTLGRVNPPEDIKRQRVQTAEEQQRQQTEIQTKIAEDNRKDAETSRASADNAYRQSLGLSPEQFVELQRIDAIKSSCASKVKCTFIVGNGTALVNSK